MPSRNVIKTYIENGYYHVYNRGYEKRKIFLDKQDYNVFTFFMRRCLDPSFKIKPPGLINTHSVANEASLLSYSLMSNHFHFLIKQKTKDAVTKFLRRQLTSYVLYFNRKYKRQGILFQGKPRGVLVTDEVYLLHLSRYIHLNASEIESLGSLENYPYSSYPTYLGFDKKPWINTSEILHFFASAQKTSLKDILSYQSFVENYSKDSREVLGKLALD